MDMEIRPREKQLSAMLLMLSLLLVGTAGGGCHAKQDHSATVAKANTDLVASAETNRACWLPEGYTIPPGKAVIGPIQAQDECKFGDLVDVLVGGSDPVTLDSPYVTVTNLMVVAGTDAPKDCLPVGMVAIECTLEQRELLQGHGSPHQNWARLHSSAGGNPHNELRMADTRRGVEVLRGTELETVYFNPSNGVAVSRRQEEEK
jgi:hypothetical protein